MGIDAVALLRPRSRTMLRKRLKAARRAAPPTLRPLDDGAVLWFTHVRFGTTNRHQLALRAMLTDLLGDDPASVHDDPGGVLFFPDVCEPQARSYAGVVAEVEDAGVWIPTKPLTPEQREAFEADLVAEVNRLLADPAALEAEMTARLQRAQSITLGPVNIDIDATKVGARAAGLDFSAGVSACVLVNRQRPLATPLAGANQVLALADGAQIVVTTRFASDHAMVALQLGAEHASWLDGHSDARGVLVFGDKLLDEVLPLATYDEAVRKIGKRGRWIKPKSGR
jgi:hypothetical protein